ncbi:MAG: glutamate--tRNA ligase, partial [Clostridia bacterium]|nr:glutamate--tRNA ligase [Clostridia bacterium]
MDYIKLANLLFPDIDITLEECIASYSKRILPLNAEVTRIAPSPTGYLHIGTVYGAFIDKLLAYHSNGVYYMRLEDTDAKREVENSGDIACQMLSYFGLKPDEGFMGSNKSQVGDYGDYVQSKRSKIYCAFAKHLVSIGRAYPCFCKSAENKEEILKRREEQLEENSDIEEKDVCRDLSLEQIEQNLKENKPFAIRFKSMGDPEKTFKFVDQIKGEREIRENAKDIVILKSNKTPPYSLAHVADDTLMQTTTVVRGEEWYPSLSSHLELFKAFNLPAPKYAHTPVVCKLDESGNKRKLSKRKDPEADARYFVEKGYPVSSVMEYLLNLINSDFEDWRKKNPTLSYYEFPFKVSKIGSNNPMFDFVKLDDMSKQVISKFTPQEIYEGVLSYAKEFDNDFYKVIKDKKDYCEQLFSIDRVNSNNPRKDIAKWS